MGLFKEFKEFAMRGNVVDLAVGLIMGASFTKIVNSLVSDVIMPPIGYLIGGKTFEKLSFPLPEIKIPYPDPTDPTKMLEKVLEPVEVKYGAFIQNSFDFLVVALCVFLLIKGMNYLWKKKEAAPPPEPPAQEKLLTEIRDLLKSQQAKPSA